MDTIRAHVFPAHADALFLDGKGLDAGKPFDLPAGKETTLIVREGKAAAALRIFAADGIDGQAARFAVKYDGNEWGAGRFVVYHYQGKETAAEPGATPLAGVYLCVERCENEGAFAEFRSGCPPPAARARAGNGCARAR